MNYENIVALERKLSLPETHFVSGNVYTDKTIFETEKSKIFFHTWHFLCHESELLDKYDFRTISFLGQPLIIIRGSDNKIRSFLNVCSHRGAKIIHSPSGNSKKLTCFYHLWSYNDRGECTSIPREKGYDNANLQKRLCGLTEIKTDVFMGMIFISFNKKIMPLNDFIGNSLDPFKDTLCSGELEVFHYSKSTIKSNWKAWQETNLDLYHEWMHVLLRKTQINAGNMKDRKVKIMPNGHAMVGGLKAKYGAYKGINYRQSSKALPGLSSDDFFFVDLFPNFAILARGTAIRIDTVTPIDENTSLVEWRGLGLRGDTSKDRRLRWKHHNQYWGPFGRNVPEDAFAAEACGEGFIKSASRYQIIAREENGTGQDDGMLRAWYKEWSKLTSLNINKP
ncbi:MAG: 2-aminobenzenesulfonate 2,3-dioxygenase subunit alpha [Alphaproteobacteria bacterium MarineAlpha2_Bin1]|nr:MAG: 2-aminobenzenesulfonate 2,3-dioxygenase subunit alpha [Alphaproteobacteria bacterium MarineAlpha2_Bin1]